MTEAPVPLAAQIEKVRRELRYAQEGGAQRAERILAALDDAASAAATPAGKGGP